jgi:hypothetical protein
MPEDKKFELLLQCWTVAYEKTIVAERGTLAKKMIDEASCEAVNDLTERLLEKRFITPPDAEEKSKDTIEESIRHHISNLTKGDMFNPDEEKLTIKERTVQGKQAVEITVENCTYQECCEWALDEPVFDVQKGLYRCQRLGCFIGAVKKYMKEEKFLKEGEEKKEEEERKNLVEARREKLSYLMKTVMEFTEKDQKNGIKCRCKGWVFISEDAIRRFILDAE